MVSSDRRPAANVNFSCTQLLKNEFLAKRKFLYIRTFIFCRSEIFQFLRKIMKFGRSNEYLTNVTRFNAFYCKFSSISQKIRKSGPVKVFLLIRSFSLLIYSCQGSDSSLQLRLRADLPRCFQLSWRTASLMSHCVPLTSFSWKETERWKNDFPSISVIWVEKKNKTAGYYLRLFCPPILVKMPFK